MANNFLNTQWVSMEILRLLVNKLVCVDYFNREWQKDFREGIRAWIVCHGQIPATVHCCRWHGLSASGT
jgi:hypothetical protein